MEKVPNRATRSRFRSRTPVRFLSRTEQLKRNGRFQESRFKRVGSRTIKKGGFVPFLMGFSFFWELFYLAILFYDYVLCLFDLVISLDFYFSLSFAISIFILLSFFDANI